MNTISNELVKDLRTAFSVWQQDYDPVEDKAQYEMFGLGVVAMDELLALRKERERAEHIVKAAEKLVRCKGRYHSEQNYRALAALFGVITPDLPPLETDTAAQQFESLACKASVPDGWKLVPVEPTVEMQIAFAETWFSKVRCVDDCELEDAYIAMLAAAPEPCK